MARRRLSSGRGVRSRYSAGGRQRISYPSDADFLLNQASGDYRGNVRRLSGIGIQQPGYEIVGARADSRANTIIRPRVYKVVSPLTGQGPADPLATGRYANMDANVVSVERRRVAKTVAPNTGSRVVRPPYTAVRRMDTRGTGTVGYY